MRKFSFCGILLASCSQDDDYYESDMYTLAEMETRSGGGDPGGGQPSPVITNVDSITVDCDFCFFPDDVFNSSTFQHSPIVAIDPSLYGSTYIEVDAEVTMKRVNNVPQVTSFSCMPAVMVYYPPTGNNPDTIFGPISLSDTISSINFEVMDVYLQHDGSAMPDRYILYATGFYTTYDGREVNCTAFIPNHIYR